MKYVSLIVIFIALFAFSTLKVNAQEITPNPSANDQSQFSSLSQNPTPTPTPPPSHPFAYTPLPTSNGGPENDIIESQPLTESRSLVQVDDWVTFSVTLQNVASYNKMLQNVCFESSDGNFGCAWGINLAPGQMYTVNNVGSWTQGGTKNIWITWSQDGMNYYQPLHANTVSVSVLN